MKYARLDRNRQVIEVIELKADQKIENCFHKDVVSQLVRMSEVEIGDHVDEKGKNHGKKPERWSRLEKGKWVKDEAVFNEIENCKACDDAFAYLKEINVDRHTLEDKKVLQAIITLLTRR
jgi:hypothetical protein